MSSGDPMPSGDDPFSGLPFFGDIAKAMSGQGPLHWDAARQFASLSATGGESEPNVDPMARIALGEFARILDLHVRDVTGVDISFPEILPITRGVWAQRTLDAYRPLFTEMATSLGRRGDDGTPTDPMAAMMANLSQMMAPAMMGMAVGSMVGRMAARTFGQYDLPIPREGTHLLVVPANIDTFAADWSLDPSEMRMWVLAQELIGHTLFSLGDVRAQLTGLVRRYVGAFRPDPNAVAEHLGQVDMTSGADPMQALQGLFNDPAVLLGAVQSPEQAELAPVLDAAVAGVVGYVDYLVDSVAVRVIGGDALSIAEAVRRRRIEASPDTVFVERLLGLHLDHEQVQRGKSFVAGVVDRVGEHRLSDLAARPGSLPTPAELEAHGLWVARLELGA